MNIVRVSVVVPTYKRPDLLNRCIAALVTQEFDSAAFEIIVADDAGDPETRQLVDRWAIGWAPSRVRYVEVTGAHGPAAARNTGWRVARGGIIAFTDDDCIPDPGWLKAGEAALMAGLDGACGKIVVPLSERPTDYEADVSGLENAEFATANCFYRRRALSAVGGFDERFTMPWREDADLFFTLLEHGFRLDRVSAAVVVHPPRRAPWGTGLRQHRKIMFNALLYKKHPQLYRERVHPLRPVQYYGMVGALLFALISALTGHGESALAGLIVWLLLTVRFCVRRLHGKSHSIAHVAEMIVTSVLIPPVAIFWRLVGAIKFKVAFA